MILSQLFRWHGRGPDSASHPHQADPMPAQGSAAMFVQAERSGLKLAIIGRTVALVLLGAFLVGTRARDPSVALAYLIVLSLLAGLGLVHYLLIAKGYDKRWVRYFFVTLDIAILSGLVGTQPLYQSAEGLSPVMIFRAPIIPFYFVIVGISALSFSPGLVLWSGVAGAIGWLAAFYFSSAGLDGVLNWTDVPSSPTSGEVHAVLLHPNFGGLGSRIQEALALVVLALLVAVVMLRARRTLERQLEAERDRATLYGIFGRFVPKAIVDAMVAGRGSLPPVEREATVLFVDIVSFTEMTERLGAGRTVAIMNAYFDEVAQIVASYNGVVTQFLGDGILATFNVPVEDPRHAMNAFETARAITRRVAARSFDGERIDVRIGINTGAVLAGNVGGGGRQSYTVYGAAVNLAARLEALCKEHGTVLLLSESTAKELPHARLVVVGDVAVRGLAKRVTVFSMAPDVR
jgi:class 3 adenylate cyclase